VIEHDNDRMARGEPCTHIYAYNDRTTPVATFHCTHLERDRADEGVVVDGMLTGMVGLQGNARTVHILMLGEEPAARRFKQSLFEAVQALKK